MRGVELTLEPAGVPAVVVVATTAFVYAVYHLATSRPAVQRFFPETRASEDALRTRIALWRRYLGAVLFGLVPLAVALLALPGGLSDYGLNVHQAPLSIGLAAGMVAILVLLVLLQSRKPWFAAHYPEVRTRTWTPGLVANNALSWVCYLIGYEFLFRGFLLLGLAPVIGAWPAIAFMTACYVFVHLPKNAAEILGSFPLGVLYGVVVIETGSILMPLLAHIGQAVLADTIALRRHPEMRLQR